MRKRTLPEGDIVSIFWNISENYGGMTKVLLERTSRLAVSWNKKATIFLLSHKQSLDEALLRLSQESKLSDHVVIRSPWHEIGDWPDADLSMNNTRCENSRSVADTSQFYGEAKNVRHGSDGQILQSDFFRRDGSVWGSYRNDMAISESSPKGTSRITLFARDGRTVSEWSTMTSFLQDWLGTVLSGAKHIVFSDSHFVGALFSGFTRENIKTIQTIHSSHLEVPNSVHGRCKKSEINLYKKLDGFDEVVTLTESHKRDLVDAGIARGNRITVIPNFYEGASQPVSWSRTATAGVYVGSLKSIKRVDHVIEAVSKSPNSISVDIYGSGEIESQLKQQVYKLDLADRVTLKGHVPAAAEKFGNYSFSVLASESEGQGLVLLESMAAGCIPISYDVKYGPSELIAHGVNGLLVPSGDIAALARAITEVSVMEPERLAQMRKNAVNKAAEFLPKYTLERWRNLLNKTGANSLPSPREVSPQITATVSKATLAADHTVLRLQVDLQPGSAIKEPMLAWIGRTTPIFGRIILNRKMPWLKNTYTVNLPLERLGASHFPGDISDFYVDGFYRDSPVRVRILMPDQFAARFRGFNFYSTKFGNFSFKLLSTD